MSRYKKFINEKINNKPYSQQQVRDVADYIMMLFDNKMNEDLGTRCPELVKYCYIHKPKILSDNLNTYIYESLSILSDNELFENGDFLMTKREVTAIKPINQIVQYIDTMSSEKINLSKIRDRLNDSSKFYGLAEVWPKELTIDKTNLDDVDKSIKSENPIVIDKDGDVIDGRHRTRAAQLRGDRLILAWAPMNMNLKESTISMDIEPHYMDQSNSKNISLKLLKRLPNNNDIDKDNDDFLKALNLVITKAYVTKDEYKRNIYLKYLEKLIKSMI